MLFLCYIIFVFKNDCIFSPLVNLDFAHYKLALLYTSNTIFKVQIFKTIIFVFRVLYICTCPSIKRGKGLSLVVILWQLDLQLPMQTLYVTTKVVSLNPAHGEEYTIQYYVKKFVSDLRQVGGFLRVLRFPQPIKLTATI